MVQSILMIDDDLDDQEILASIIYDIDPSIKFESVNDGIYGLEKLLNSAGYFPDCIFIDINMPRMNGIEFLTAFKKLSGIEKTVTIVYSTLNDEIAIDECKKLGADLFISKTAYLDEVTTKLTGLFNLNNQTI